MPSIKKQSSADQAKRDVAAGVAVLNQEIKGLEALADTLNEKFSAAVETIYNIKGRVIVSGMGKSGHIARKIAATFASTGTPAFFVHPGEASHGDLGMITPDDALILLSNSGETAELKDIIEYTRRFSIPLIAVVRRQSSVLVESADIALVLPEIPEASNSAAPTTSTTMMIAFGDALAVALMQRRGFKPEDLQVFHPGGKIGKNFIKVSDLMRTGENMPVVKETAPMSETLLVITEKSLGCAGVVDADGKLTGIITDGDLRRHMKDNIVAMKAREVMTQNPLKIRPNALALEALALMNEKKVTNLFVLEKGRPAGIIHIHDVLRAGVS